MSYGPSQRQLRVGELVRRVLGELLMRGDLHEEPILTRGGVVVSEVRPTPDLRNAIVYVTAHGSEDTDEAVAALKRMKPLLKSRVAQAVRLKYAVNLEFVGDGSFDEAERITRLLNEKR